MEPVVLMSAIVASATATAVETARQVLRSESEWPTPATGLAFRVCIEAGMTMPLMAKEPRGTTRALLRRTPELAAFGYVLDMCSDSTASLWLDGVEHLRGRDIYPADRQSFVFNPIEILGIANGLAHIRSHPETHREWLIDTILRGINSNLFRTGLSSFAALTALLHLDPSSKSRIEAPEFALDSLSTTDLLLLAAIGLGFPRSALTDIERLRQAVLKRVLGERVAVNDAAEAAALLGVFQGMLNGIAPGVSESSPTDKIIALCRRFPLFLDRLQKRQRNREPFVVEDEYDVQDLLHAILRLHFDDVRPEEYTPSYAGNASKVDFYLPQEHLVVEAKMTRSNLGQRELTNELIIDAARYSQMDRVDTLVCFVYDPQRRCGNPQAIERDLQNSGGRLAVRVVICPQGL
jgi:hypothetical protein